MTDESQISEREREILRLVATGATNQQIASQLNISINTVKVHLRNIFGKIGVVSRTEATLYAVRSGLVTVERATSATAVADEPEEPAPLEALDPPPALAVAVPAVATTPYAQSPEVAAGAQPSARSAVADGGSFSPPPPTGAADAHRGSPQPKVVPPATARGAATLNPLMLGLAALALLVVGGLIATFLLQPAPPAPSPTAAAGLSLPAADQRWNELAPMPEPRAAFALAPASFNAVSYLFAIGGEGPEGVSGAVLRYDLAADTWTNYTPKPTPVADVQAAVIGGKIYVPGGRLADGSLTDALEVYDPQRDSWDKLARLPTPRSRYALAAVEGKLYLFGGWDGRDFAAQVWQYTPDTDEWAELSPMAVARADAGAAELNDQVYLVGGENNGGPLTRLDRYNPAAEDQGSPWEVRAPLPEPRSRMAVAGASDKLFVFGGPVGAHAYDDPRDRWEPVALPVELRLSDLRAQFVGSSRVYIIGGLGAEGLGDGAFAYQALFVVNLPVSGN